MYDWNKDMNFDWYVKHSGLNAVELNASFYRFPYPNQVRAWARKGAKLRWAIKVHRSITHYSKLRGKALEVWLKFKRLFNPMEHLIDFYLFQLPPSYTKTENNIDSLERFLAEINIGIKAAIEFRHTSWFNKDTIDLLNKYDATIVSIDAPIGTWITVSRNNIVYLRMHGRTYWYAHNYSVEELAEVAMKVKQLNPRRVYVFFNNNHWMLENARTMLSLLTNILK